MKYQIIMVFLASYYLILININYIENNYQLDIKRNVLYLYLFYKIVFNNIRYNFIDINYVTYLDA